MVLLNLLQLVADTVAAEMLCYHSVHIPQAPCIMLGLVKIDDQFIQFSSVSQGTYPDSRIFCSDILYPFTAVRQLRKSWGLLQSVRPMHESLPHGLLPLTIWENIMLLGIRVASIY